jgi:hypothetical protein
MAKEFHITKASGCCCTCRRQLEPGDRFAASLHETDEQFLRKDWCPDCWDREGQQQNGDLIGSWQSRIPAAKEKKKLFVDNDVLLNFFRRLEGTDQPERQAFRFVLGLILMQKRLLRYEKTLPGTDEETWLMRVRGSDETFQLHNPQISEEEIAQVSDQLGQILEADL